MSRDQWPPGAQDDESGPLGPADAEHVVATTSTPVTSKTGRCCDSNGAWRRRREASRRLPVLDCRCRTADPWLHTCDRPPLSDCMVDAYRDTVLHLRQCGLLAAPRLPEMQVLWRRSPEERRLVSEIAERWELAG
jgi:hypothetical protein